MDTIIYKIDGKTYINLTNKCSNKCDFCVRNNSEKYCDYYLWLTKEPTADEVIASLKKDLGSEEYVFCGFGEPLYALDRMINIAEFLKKNGKRTRLNTNGQADLIVGEGVAERIKGKIDTVSISLNAPTKEGYQSVCHSIFGEDAFRSLIAFAENCKALGIKVILSIVDTIGEGEIQLCQELADSLGIRLRVRKYISANA